MLKGSVLAELRTILGPRNFSTTPEDLVVYSYDATRQESLPWAVARPASASEISQIMVLANREGYPVVPRGAGTGMSGGSVPVRGGIVLSLERMNRILMIDEANLIAVVEPGVITGDLQREVESRGLFYPPDPASHLFCTIGGNVAECAGGLRAIKYGVTRDYVLGLEVVLPTGEIITTGAQTLKSVAGYDLTRLIVGSEGTLGVVTRVILRLLPLPDQVRTLSAFFPGPDAAAGAASAIIARRIIPRALEFVDHEALRAVGTYLNEDISQGASALLIVEVDGSTESTAREISRVEEIVQQFGASRISSAESEPDRALIWKARRSISPALATIKPHKLNEDIVVPRSRIPDILASIAAIAKNYNLLIVNFGHAGDGNLHTNILFDEVDREKAERAVREILKETVRMNGSISGEHGIGSSKARFLPLEVNPDALRVMQKIKQALDPKGVLNPGKIFFDQHADSASETSMKSDRSR